MERKQNFKRGKKKEFLKFKRADIWTDVMMLMADVRPEEQGQWKRGRHTTGPISTLELSKIVKSNNFSRYINHRYCEPRDIKLKLNPDRSAL